MQTRSGASSARADALQHIMPHAVCAAADAGELLFTLPMVDQAWRRAAQEQAAARRLRKQPKVFAWESRFPAPLHALQRHWPALTVWQQEGQLCANIAVGDLRTLQWALPQSPALAQRAVCRSAARFGSLEMLQWVRSQGCPWDEWTCSSAGERGHLEVLQWARGQGCPWDDFTCSEAARGGHLEVLQWARSEGCPWTKQTCTEAARGGHLEVLKWAHSQDCPWNAMTCSSAAERGHLAVLQWARSEGCPWDAAGCEQAALHRGHNDVAQWVRSQQAAL